MITTKAITLFTIFSALIAPCSVSAAPAAETSVETNPFKRFVGEWTLKDDRWSHNWGQGDEVIEIPGHHTVSRSINTANSILSVVDHPDPTGHILWTYDPATKTVHHLSSFGAARNGVGTGTLSDSGDLVLTISFGDEAPGTYRIYTYQWISDDAYRMSSRQYDAQGKPTGLFYGGTFVRIPTRDSRDKDAAAIQAILNVIDDTDADLATQLSVYADDVVHMAPGNTVITNRSDLGRHLAESKKHGYADMKHEVVELHGYEKIVVMRGQVTGTYHPADGSPAFPFKTKNLFVFRRQEDGLLKVWQVIYNPSPVEGVRAGS